LIRVDDRAADELRPVRLETGYTRWAEGSVLAQFGQTHVLCNVTLSDDVPGWLKAQERPQGWLTAEYAMLPRSTQKRTDREQRWPKGRTQEIARLIGRSLRQAVDLYALGPRSLVVDCDVLQADGGTRTAAITGAWVAVALALTPRIASGELPAAVLREQVAAVSVGIVDGAALLDLEYREDVTAAVDGNVVMTAAGALVELQATGEKMSFSRPQLDGMLNLATIGLNQLFGLQRQAVQGGIGD
jgi:ribonuclease PH